MGAAAVPIATAVAPTLLGAALGGTKPQATFPGAYRGALGLQNSLLQFLQGGTGGVQRGTGGGLDVLLGLAGVGGNTGQQRGSTGVGQMSNQQSPEMRTLNVAFPALQQILTSNSAASGLSALQPVFQQNLQDQSNRLTATAPGGRFSSGMLQAQAQLGQRSLNDFNLMASNMLQEGIRNQLGAAQTLGGLSNQAGNAQMNALQMLFGGAFGNAFSGPVLAQSSGLQQGLGAGSGLARLLMMARQGGGGGGGGGAYNGVPILQGSPDQG